MLNVGTAVIPAAGGIPVWCTTTEHLVLGVAAGFYVLMPYRGKAVAAYRRYLRPIFSLLPEKH